MKNTRVWVLVFVSMLLLQACTIANYEIRNNLYQSGSQEYNDRCGIKFSINLSSAHHTNTFGIREHERNVLKELKEKYINSTKKVFKKYGCNANYVEDERDANFNIRVVRLRHLSALPQEWLTGLSFGLIPNWGTREKVFEYSFNEILNNRIHTYYIDEHTYNHILLFPIFWISFITANEDKVYRDTLEDFIKPAPNKAIPPES